MYIPEKTVSVVIPTCNRAELLHGALQSVLAQTHPPYEVIVVDDCATHTAVESADCSQIRYMRNERRQGAAGARNTGILHARGQYIAFLDDDDRWCETKIERQLSFVERYDGIVCGSTSRASRSRRLPEGPIDRDILRRGCYLEGGSSAVLVRTELLKSNLFDESLRRWQDWDLLIRLTSTANVAYMDEPLVIYNDGAHPRITNAPRVSSMQEVERCLFLLEKHGEFFGPYWRKRHLADGLLAYIRHRRDKLSLVRYAIDRTSVWHVAEIGIGRLLGRMEIGRALW